MDLTHQFTVPTSVEETWDSFLDIGSLAECFPGAQVTSAEGDTFTGTVKVKLGPIAMVYAGSGTFVEKDESARRLVVEAKGRDKRGNGTAGANATLTMAPEGTGTKVEIVTDLAVTGKPAQFGRGVMQDVSDKLLGQFVACLEQKSAPAEPEPPAVEEPSGDGISEPAKPAPTAGSPGPQAPKHAAPKQAEAIDLGATVVPVLIKNYGKKIAIGVAVIAAVVIVYKLLRG
ncbi:SRPBCC family protein [Nocardioides sp. NPDC051685]|uniref:SRPBCC family protein n=1 Tax=Nocardioides sp. NPDC051685 TaxID=3364334 RepID=UPI0037A6BA0B